MTQNSLREIRALPVVILTYFERRIREAETNVSRVVTRDNRSRSRVLARAKNESISRLRCRGKRISLSLIRLGAGIRLEDAAVRSVVRDHRSGAARDPGVGYRLSTALVVLDQELQRERR